MLVDSVTLAINLAAFVTRVGTPMSLATTLVVPAGMIPKAVFVPTRP